jgi:acetylornithine deacetylase
MTRDRVTTAAQVLDSVESCAAEMLADVVDVVRVPSVSGTDAENDAQAHMARVLGAGGLDVDNWRIDLERLAAHADFPGMEVDRREAWGLVGRLPGTGDGSATPTHGPRHRSAVKCVGPTCTGAARAT